MVDEPKETFDNLSSQVKRLLQEYRALHSALKMIACGMKPPQPSPEKLAQDTLVSVAGKMEWCSDCEKPVNWLSHLGDPANVECEECGKHLADYS